MSEIATDHIGASCPPNSCKTRSGSFCQTSQEPRSSCRLTLDYREYYSIGHTFRLRIKDLQVSRQINLALQETV